MHFHLNPSTSSEFYLAVVVTCVRLNPSSSPRACLPQPIIMTSEEAGPRRPRCAKSWGGRRPGALRCTSGAGGNDNREEEEEEEGEGEWEEYGSGEDGEQDAFQLPRIDKARPPPLPSLFSLLTRWREIAGAVWIEVAGASSRVAISGLGHDGRAAGEDPARVGRRHGQLAAAGGGEEARDAVERRAGGGPKREEHQGPREVGRRGGGDRRGGRQEGQAPRWYAPPPPPIMR